MKKSLQNIIVAVFAIIISSGCNHQNTQTKEVPATQNTIKQKAVATSINTCLNTDSTIVVARQVSTPAGRVIGSKRVTTTVTDTIAADNVMLLIDSGAVSRDVKISIVATTEENSGEIPANMANLTADGAVYRMLPDGQKFDKDITIAMRYDSTALPFGFTPDDIYTFFYNEQTRMWQQVERDSVDTRNQIVYSRTNHFTDYINGVLKVPENSDAMAYTPTSIKDLKAADPMEGITLIAPPEANNMGTANLTYPLNIPAGRHGMQPNLAVTYNSAGGSGILGLGWSLPISEISVETRWGVPLYSPKYETEGYLLDGTTLVSAIENRFAYFQLNKPVYHRKYELRDPNINTQQFYPRVEGAFRKIERFGTSPDNYYWVVTDKDGTRHFYGLTDQSKLRDHKRNIAKWMLEKSVDTYGNTVTYSYITQTVNNGNQQPLGKQLCIRKIQYTGVDGTNDHGQYIIRFGYIDKPDKTNSFRYGLEEINNYLLDSIQVMFRDTIVREYYFGYKEGEFGKTLLCKIFEGYDDNARNQTYRSSNQSNTIRGFLPFERCSIASDPFADSVYLQLFHSFDYYETGKPLFLDAVPVDHKGNDNAIVFSKHDSVQFENYNIGGSGSFGWNIGGGLNVGGDNIPWLKTVSVGGHYSYSEDYSDGFMQLVDVNGDGYPDKLYKDIWGYIMCRPQIPGQNAFDEPVEVRGVQNFQYTSSSTQNYGWEASAITAGVGKSWSDGRSNTSVFVSDVNGDGLIDIVDNGSVYINRGNYVFNNVTNNSTINITGACGDNVIDFSGEVDTSIFSDGYYTVERIVCTTFVSQTVFLDSVYDGNGHYTVIDGVGQASVYRDSCWTVTDTFYYDYPQRYEPDVDLVRMWKAPYNGVIAISGTAKLTNELSNFRSQTRTNDGVWIAIQRAGEDSTRKDSIVLLGEIRRMSCQISVNKGDTIFFRINSRDKRLYDQVEWTPHIEYLSATHSNNVAFSSSRVDANGDSIYRFDYNKDYMLTDYQSVSIGPDSGTLICTNNFSISCKIRLLPNKTLSQGMRLYLIKKNLNTTGSEIRLDSATYSRGTSPNVQESFTALGVPSDQKIFLRLVPVGGGQLNWSDIETEATVTLTHSSDATINSRLSDNNANGAYIYHPAVERVFFDYLVFPGTPVIIQPGSPNINIEITKQDNTPFSGKLYFTIKDFNHNVCFGQKIMIPSNGQLDLTSPFAFTLNGNPQYSVDCYIEDSATANSIASIKIRIGNGPQFDAGLYTKYSPDNKKHHGTLYRGWGQFGYKSPSSSYNYIRSDLIHADGYYSNGIDTSSLSENQISGFDVSTLDADSNPEITPGGIMHNPLSGSFFEMHADTEKKRWKSYANLVTASRTISSLDNSDPVVENGQSATVNMFQSPLPVRAHGAKVKAVNKVTMNKGNEYTKSQISHSEGYSRLLGDFMDLNGDRYPDNVSEKVIQYSRAQGGLGDLVCGYSDTINRNAPYGINRTNNSSIGYAYNGSFLNMMFENVPNAKKSRAVTTVSGLLQLVNGNQSQGSDQTQNTFLDINGDGLADIVYSNDSVRFNMGYCFSSPRRRLTSPIRSSVSDAVSSGVGLNVANTSITVGVSRNTSDNTTTFALMDINGDGLPDKITPSQVFFNNGNSFMSHSSFVGIDKSSSTTFSLNVSGTYDYVLFPFFKVGGSAGGGASFSLCHSGAEFVDMNNDGNIDYVFIKGDQILVRYSNIDRANLLKSVTNFAGAEMQIDYQQSTATVQSPQRHWNMSSLTIHDGHNGDGASTIYKRFSYGNRCYDRFERDDYGYDTVKTYDYETQAHFYATPPNTIYRTTTQIYHNDDFYHAHLKKSERVSKGNKYVETAYTYADANISDGNYFEGNESVWCEGMGWPAVKTERSRYCEGPGGIISTKREYLYGPYGNVIQVIDYGDSIDANDDYTVIISYSLNPSLYIVANVSEIDIPGYRNRQATYNAKGSISSLTINNYPNPQSVFQFVYDRYGNDSLVTTPAIHQGTNSHYWIKYTYDPLTHTLPVRVDNAEGHFSTTQYTLLWQKPINTIDISNNRMHYAYDKHGRIDTIIAPKEIATHVPYTVKYDYWYNQKYSTTNPVHFFPDILRIKYSWARTRNCDPANPGNNINTVTFSDGLGRIIQVKKDFDEDGVEKRIVGGTVHYDVLGRKIKEFYPITENISELDDALNTDVNNAYYTQTYYDYLDRPVQVNFPDSTSTSNSYSISPDASNINRFRNAATDQNDHTSYVYTDPRQLNIQFTDALNHTTEFHYDAVGQLVSSKDPEQNITTHTYDRGGRRTRRVHPSSGRITWDYDAAGNMTKQTQNSGEYIEYFYDYSRPVHIAYSNRSWNDVWYEYGAAGSGNQAGRLIRQQDASGVQRFHYDNMGNVDTNWHTYVQPNISSLFTLKTVWNYDSWGRVIKIKYPDTEEVSYSYDHGGNVKHIEGNKYGQPTSIYVDTIFYDRFGQRTGQKYHNGYWIKYQYNPQNHRLTSLIDSSASTGFLQKNQYTYDDVGNITEIEDLGLYPRGQSFEYDKINRLVNSGGYWGNPALIYTSTYTYSDAGKMIRKNVSSYRRSTAMGDYSVRYTNRYNYSPTNPFAVSSVLDSMTGVSTYFEWDDNGNLIQSSCHNPLYNRNLCWTEDNRLQGYTENSMANGEIFAWYNYDAGGNRNLKMTTPPILIRQNADGLRSSAYFRFPTLYASALITINRYGYTKHYFEGTNRICSRIGGGFDNANWSELTEPVQSLDGSYTSQINNQLNSIIQTFRGCLNADFYLGEVFDLFNVISHAYNHPQGDEPIFYYHSDHLGSAAYLTDENGQVAQTLNYLPYGEDWIDIQNNLDPSLIQYRFNGKEKDYESGFHYYGARYYWSELLTGWLSVDPLTDKYPGISPYAYCHWNPIKLVDPNGQEDYQVDNNGNITKCKDQSHAVEGKDRLFRGRPKFDKNGQPKKSYVEATEGTFGEYNEETKRGITKYNLYYEDLDGNQVPYSPYEIKINEGSSDASERKATEIFEFLSKNTRVEWTYFGLGSPESDELQSVRITTSRIRGYEPYGFGRARRWKEWVKFAYHPHKNAKGASKDGYDDKLPELVPNATLGIYHTWSGSYFDFNGNRITGPKR